ncbi:sensor histidine kinase [Spirosoma koreense]
MTSFIDTLLARANLPITRRQFWRYALVFWSTLAVVSYIQHTLTWLLTNPGKMYLYESLQWLVTYLMWLGLSPFIIYTTQRFPIPLTERNGSWGRTILGHVLVSSLFGLLVAVVSFVFVKPLYAYETGHVINPLNILVWFLYTYSLTVITYLLVVVGYYIWVHVHQYQALKEQNLKYELNNEQLKTQLANAQLQSLKMQLNPHFLFNTHHAIVSLMLQNDNRKAIDMVTALSDLLRGVLAKQDTNFLTLRDELTLTQQYLAIQQIRFQDRLRIEYDIDPTTETCLVPQLLLQPLVENAVTHGVSGLTTDALIRISTRKRADTIQITVYDNGIGQRRKSRGGSGLGLSNTRLRLRQAYGEAAQFDFDQPAGGTTLVQLTFPGQPSLLTPSQHDNLSLAHH